MAINILKKHRISISICIFFILLMIIHTNKPLLLYNRDGSVRQFGLGRRKKTIIPLWLISITLPIFIYTMIRNYSLPN